MFGINSYKIVRYGVVVAHAKKYSSLMVKDIGMVRYHMQYKTPLVYFMNLMIAHLWLVLGTHAFHCYGLMLEKKISVDLMGTMDLH